MKVREEPHDEYLLLALNGELDASSAIKVDQVIQKAVQNGTYSFLIDCSELKYISSAGVGVFISYIEDLREHDGKFVFYEMREGVYDVFKTLGLHQILTITRQEDEAKKAIHES